MLVEMYLVLLGWLVVLTLLLHSALQCRILFCANPSFRITSLFTNSLNTNNTPVFAHVESAPLNHKQFMCISGVNITKRSSHTHTHTHTLISFDAYFFLCISKLFVCPAICFVVSAVKFRIFFSNGLELSCLAECILLRKGYIRIHSFCFIERINSHSLQYK